MTTINIFLPKSPIPCQSSKNFLHHVPVEKQDTRHSFLVLYAPKTFPLCLLYYTYIWCNCSTPMEIYQLFAWNRNVKQGDSKFYLKAHCCRLYDKLICHTVSFLDVKSCDYCISFVLMLTVLQVTIVFLFQI